MMELLCKFSHQMYIWEHELLNGSESGPLVEWPSYVMHTSVKIIRETKRWRQKRKKERERGSNKKRR